MESLSNKGVNYDIKILLAWGESISGNSKITEWLTTSGYPELGLFHFALRNEERSRKWLMENEFPHLLALINGVEQNKKALKWLEDNGFDIIHQMALAGDGDNDAYDKLLRANLKVYAMIARKIQFVKDEIETNKSDFHRYNAS